MKKRYLHLLLIGILVVLMGCNKDENEDAKKFATQASAISDWLSSLPNSILDIGDETVTVPPGDEKTTVRPEANHLRNAYFGDLHVHSRPV